MTRRLARYGGSESTLWRGFRSTVMAGRRNLPGLLLLSRWPVRVPGRTAPGTGRRRHPAAENRADQDVCRAVTPAHSAPETSASNSCSAHLNGNATQVIPGHPSSAAAQAALRRTVRGAFGLALLSSRTWFAPARAKPDRELPVIRLRPRSGFRSRPRRLGSFLPGDRPPRLVAQAPEQNRAKRRRKCGTGATCAAECPDSETHSPNRANGNGRDVSRSRWIAPYE